MYRQKLSTIAMLFGAWSLGLHLSACSDNDSPTASHDQDTGVDPFEAVALVDVGSLQDQGVRVTLRGPETLEAGYAPLEVKLADATGDAPIHSASVQILPLMHMQTEEGITSHSAPVEPPAGTDAIEGVFPHPVVFIMPGTWQLQVTFVAGDRQGGVTFEVEVEESRRLARVTGEDGNTYFLALVAPRVAVVGRQPLEVAVFKRETMNSFPPVTDLRLSMEPTMPSMGHGSPENEDPVHGSAGHYLGMVNFIMTGDWRIDLMLMRDDVHIGAASFDVTVE